MQFAAVKIVEGDTSDHAKSVNDARTSIIQLLGGAGLVGGLIYTVRSFGLARSTQRAERFTKAVGQMGDQESESVRAGGVHSLRLLALEDAGYWPIVEQTLCSLIRERAADDGRIGAEVQAALTTIGERPDKLRVSRRPLDLRGVYLPKANLVGANLQNAWFDHATLIGADFTDARLTYSVFAHGNLENAIFSNADCTSVDFSDSVLRKAVFYKATKDSADFSGSDRTGATGFDGLS
ncbi:pentapeptide repeat-containing protein [Pseudarthrobacter albicanus]|uniref:pentapeptide repeat-containing protein n=1 Tax=Pseudarthrobacter albicanus TaxID=2823873 RepID=UPI001BA61655|nr:pentapeptide repeat-containing protein [Pseudarthrobacter albicanus]